jgi:hypothetical protein
VPLLTREALLAPESLPVEAVAVPEWGGTVHVRVLTGAERDAFEAANTRIVGRGRDRKIEANLANYRARLAVLVCCDEHGQRIFQDDDAPLLGRKSAAGLDRIVEAAHRLNGMREDSMEQAEGN